MSVPVQATWILHETARSQRACSWHNLCSSEWDKWCKCRRDTPGSLRRTCHACPFTPGERELVSNKLASHGLASVTP